MTCHPRPEPDRVHDEKPRRCLMCREFFGSCWDGERVCPRCKGTSRWQKGAALREP